MFKEDPARLRLLLETRRIVFNNMPFRSGEYEDSILINDLMVKESFRAVINRKTVSHAIIEMYASTEVCTCSTKNLPMFNSVPVSLAQLHRERQSRSSTA